MTTPTAQAPAARADNLSKIYGDGPTRVTALDQVGLEIGSRSFTAIMGPSGSGKSTLMHCMAGLDSADGGQVWIGGTEITALPERRLTRLRRDRVGFVFQAYNLLPALTAADNITLPLDIAGRSADRAWLDAVVDSVGQGPRDGDPLLLPARQLRGAVPQPRAQALRVHDGAEPGLVGRAARDVQREGDVVRRGEGGQQVVGLEDEADVVAA